MRVSSFLAVGLAVLTVGAWQSAVAPSARAEGCSRDVQITTGCPVSISPGIGDGGVNLGGSTTTPRTPQQASGGPRQGGGANTDAPPPVACTIAQCREEYTLVRPTDGRGPITLADLVNFRPVAGVERMEPNGWMVVGLDTNFYVATGAHVQNNLLLGLPAAVRFTPVAYHWSYGDGTSVTRTAKGSSWAAQALPEFSPTATSHVYRDPGTYTIALTTDFRAEYSFGGAAWIPIDGTVPVASAPLTATAGSADTVLVARECTVSPKGPGC